MNEDKINKINRVLFLAQIFIILFGITYFLYFLFFGFPKWNENFSSLPDFASGIEIFYYNLFFIGFFVICSVIFIDIVKYHIKIKTDKQNFQKINMTLSISQIIALILSISYFFLSLIFYKPKGNPKELGYGLDWFEVFERGVLYIFISLFFVIIVQIIKISLDKRLQNKIQK